MLDNTVIIIKKRIGGKYATLLGDFALESSEKLVYHFEGILMENDNQKKSFLKNAHSDSFCQHGSQFIP